ITRDCEAVISGSNGSSAGKIGYRYGRAAVGISAITKLAINVVAPCHYRPVALDGQGMVLTRSNSNRVGDSDCLHRYKAGAGGAVAKLAIGVVAPIPNCSVTP